MIENSFLEMYSQLGIDYLKSGVFQKLHQISTLQAYVDRLYLYGMLMTATSHFQNKIIIKYQSTQDNFMTWSEFKKYYGFEGSKNLRIEFFKVIA